MARRRTTNSRRTAISICGRLSSTTRCRGRFLLSLILSLFLSRSFSFFFPPSRKTGVSFLSSYRALSLSRRSCVRSRDRIVSAAIIPLRQSQHQFSFSFSPCRSLSFSPFLPLSRCRAELAARSARIAIPYSSRGRAIVDKEKTAHEILRDVGIYARARRVLSL